MRSKTFERKQEKNQTEVERRRGILDFRNKDDIGCFSNGGKGRGIKEIIEQVEDNRKSDGKTVKD